MAHYNVFGLNYSLAEAYPWRQLWSLAIEEHLYFFFPGLLLFVAQTSQRRLLLMIVMLVLPFFWRLVIYYLTSFPPQYDYFATNTRIDAIAWGLPARAVDAGARKRERRVEDLWFIGRATLAIGLAIILGTLVYRSEAFRWTWRFTLQGIGIAR